MFSAIKNNNLKVTIDEVVILVRLKTKCRELRTKRLFQEKSETTLDFTNQFKNRNFNMEKGTA